MHLGADKILAISTRYLPNGVLPPWYRRNLSSPGPGCRCPPLNAIFLDAMDFDASNVERFNQLLLKLPEEDRMGLRPVDMFTARPSEDPGELAGHFLSLSFQVRFDSWSGDWEHRNRAAVTCSRC